MSSNTFNELKISDKLIKAVEEMGFSTPTEIQEKSIPLLMEGKDVIGRSQTGTGKTAAFAIPAIELVDTELNNEVQILLLCPTRELAMQACDEFKKLAKYMNGIKPVAIYGGHPIEKQIQSIKRGANIVIGTPGRVMDHMRRRTLKLHNLKMIILDEADEMLNMGFREDIEKILEDVPKVRQTVLFSATMPPPIMKITKKYLKDPELIEINKKEITLSAIKQSFYDVPMSRKKDALVLLLKHHKPKLTIIFANTKRMVTDLNDYLNRHGFKASGLHGDMNQASRTQVMNAFKNGKISILIATDVAARGIDVDDINTVINYDIPQNNEYYVHRIGRTGRAGKTGLAYTIASGKKQINQIKDIMRLTKSDIKQKDIPSPEEISEERTKSTVNKVLKLLDKKEKLEHLDMITKLCSEGVYTAEQLAAASFELLLGKNKGIDIPKIPKAKKADFGPSNSGTGPKTSRLFINVGKRHGIAPNHIVGAVAEATSVAGKDVGKINIYEHHSVFEVPSGKKDEVIKIMNGKKIKGETCRIKLDTPPDKLKRKSNHHQEEPNYRKRKDNYPKRRRK